MSDLAKYLRYPACLAAAALCLAIVPLNGFAKKHVITLSGSEVAKGSSKYSRALLKLAINSLSEDRVEIRYYGKSLSRKRSEIALENGDIDVTFLPVSQDLLSKNIPIKYPIFKGISSYRFPLIKRQNQSMLANVDSIQTLKSRYVGGAGTFWSTTKIYKQNNFNIVTAAKKTGLFYMLEGGRFDYFLRGVNEVDRELKKYADLNLMVDPNVVVYVPNASYTFVTSSRPEVAEVLKRGFKNITESGEFDAFVKNSQFYKDMLRILGQQKRKVLRVNYNPFQLPENVPEKWIDIEKLLSNQ